MANVNTTLANVVVTTGQVNSILVGILGLIGVYKQARDAFKASAQPGDVDPFLTDKELIDAFAGSSADLVALADRLLAKYQAPAQPAPRAANQADPAL